MPYRRQIRATHLRCQYIETSLCLPQTAEISELQCFIEILLGIQTSVSIGTQT